MQWIETLMVREELLCGPFGIGPATKRLSGKLLCSVGYIVMFLLSLALQGSLLLQGQMEGVNHAEPISPPVEGSLKRLNLVRGTVLPVPECANLGPRIYFQRCRY